MPGSHSCPLQLADAMAPVAQLHMADCSAFEDAMLVSCTVGRNAALPEPNSPDGTPQWRTLSLRVSERYPAESPVALFNCPSDGLPVPPQVGTSRRSCFMSGLLGYRADTVVQEVTGKAGQGMT